MRKRTHVKLGKTEFEMLHCDWISCAHYSNCIGSRKGTVNSREGPTQFHPEWKVELNLGWSRPTMLIHCQDFIQQDGPTGNRHGEQMHSEPECPKHCGYKMIREPKPGTTIYTGTEVYWRCPKCNSVFTQKELDDAKEEKNEGPIELELDSELDFMLKRFGKVKLDNEYVIVARQKGKGLKHRNRRVIIRKKDKPCPF